MIRELKDSLFVHMVGRGYIPIAKICSMILLIPAILVYARLVDSMSKHRLLYVYTIGYGIIGLIVSAFIAHPTIGLANTTLDKHRFFGWFIYFFIEGYAPFVVGLFWAFVNSITAPKEVKSSYPLLVAGSKVGGIFAALFAGWFLKNSLMYHWYSDVANHQVLFGTGSILVLCVPVVIYLLVKETPPHLLHGYEAAFRADQREKRKRLEQQQKEATSAKGLLGRIIHVGNRLFSGLSLLLSYPYVLGIFGMVFFWEIVNAVFRFERLKVGKTIALSASEYTSFLFRGIAVHQFIGLLLVLFGTRYILVKFGERKSLLLLPIIIGVVLLTYSFVKTPEMVIGISVLMSSLGYAFAKPLQESLYIPTSRDMRFKSKSWIDAFGVKFAKASGSSYNFLIFSLASGFVDIANTIFFIVVISIWIVCAHLLGRRFEKAIRNNEVIGAELSS